MHVSSNMEQNGKAAHVTYWRNPMKKRRFAEVVILIIVMLATVYSFYEGTRIARTDHIFFR